MLTRDQQQLLAAVGTGMAADALLDRLRACGTLEGGRSAPQDGCWISYNRKAVWLEDHSEARPAAGGSGGGGQPWRIKPKIVVKVTWAEAAAHGAGLSPALRDELAALQRTERLERVARAVAISVLTPPLMAFPTPLRIRGERVPRRLIDAMADSVKGGLSPLFHRDDLDSIAVRRPLIPSEEVKLDGLIRRLGERTKGVGWERDLAQEIDALKPAVEAATTAAGALLTCPTCSAAAGPAQVGREGDVFSITCRSCGYRWGLELCGHCRSRIPVIEPERNLRNPDVNGPGWVERIYGRDALASPCWARTVHGRYVCTDCRGCSLSASPQGESCLRCHAVPEPVA